MIEDKTKLETLLGVALRNFVVSQLALNRLFSSSNTELPSHIIFGNDSESFRLNIANLFPGFEDGKYCNWSKEISDNCKSSQHRALIAEVFELIKLYCEHTNQMSIFKNWEHFNFSRILRNCTSHGTGGKLNKWPPDLTKKGITSVSWGQITIDSSMIGEIIPVNEVNTVKFIKSEIDFAINKLS